jgi:hypothetical protein
MSLRSIVEAGLKDGKGDIASISTVTDWIERPIKLREFCESPEHLNFRFSDKQYEFMEDFVGPDGTRFFERDLDRASTAIWLLGKGSGKDTMARAIAMYVIYILLCLHKPREWLGFKGRGFISLVNVAYSSDQASDVYFATLVELVKAWVWLRKRYRMFHRGRMVPSMASFSPASEYVRIKEDRINFPKGIRAISEHSQQESYEGHDILFWVMDEASAFKSETKIANGDKIYSTLTTSANSRFPGRWRGIVMSFPRSESDTDFTMRMYEQALNETLRFKVARASTWEVRPPGSFSDQTFDFEGFKIPIDFEKEFKTTPADAKAKYLTIPPKIAGAFFEYPERITECINKNRIPIFRTRSTLVEVELVDAMNGRSKRERMLGQEIGEWLINSVQEMQHSRVGWVDLGRVSNRAALVIARGEPVKVEIKSETSGEIQQTTVNKLIEEAVVVWQPDPSRQLQVAVASVEALILDLMRRGLRIRMFGCDAWNSATLQEALKRHRVYTEEHVVSYADYALLQSLIYTGAAELLDHPLQTQELTRLVRVGSNKVDHPPEGSPTFGSKDIADALAGCARLLNGRLKDPQAALWAFAKRRSVGVKAQHTSAGNASGNPFSPKAQGFPVSSADMTAIRNNSQVPPDPTLPPNMLPTSIMPRRSVGLPVGGRGSSRGRGGRTSGW